LQQRGMAVRSAAGVEAALEGAAGLINATLVGMLPNRDMPVPEALLHPAMWVADVVYSPLWTPLLTAAKARGADVLTGRDLAINASADAFALFTGMTPSHALMGNAFDAVMAAR
jgi:shikimate dehydrogenase